MWIPNAPPEVVEFLRAHLVWVIAAYITVTALAIGVELREEDEKESKRKRDSDEAVQEFRNGQDRAATSSERCTVLH